MKPSLDSVFKRPPRRGVLWAYPCPHCGERPKYTRWNGTTYTEVAEYVCGIDAKLTSCMMHDRRPPDFTGECSRVSGPDFLWESWIRRNT